MDELKRKRGYCKSRYTKIVNWAKENENDKDVEKFRMRRDSMIDILEIFRTLQEEIAYLRTDETSLQDQEYDNVESLMMDTLAFLNNKISFLSSVIKTPVGQDQNYVQMPGQPSINVKLPEICIKPFSGEASDWQSFFDIFENLVIKNSQIDQLQKLIYLKGYLKDEALKLVDKLQLVESNFPIAIDILRERYEDKYTMIESHLSNLFENLQPITKINKQNLREFITIIKQNIRALENLSVPINQSDLILVHILSRKIDFNTRKAYRLQRDTKKLPTLGDFLEKHCRVLEDLTSPQTYTQSSSPRLIRRAVHHVNSVSNSSDSYPSRSNSNLKCIYCDKQYHVIHKCMKFRALSSNEKVEFVTSKVLCHNCLGLNHNAIKCLSKSRCVVCGKAHHTTLHNCQFRIQNSANNGQQPRNNNFNSHNNVNTNTNNSRIVTNSQNNSENMPQENIANSSGSRANELNRSNQSSRSLSSNRKNDTQVSESAASYSISSKQNFHVILSTAVVTVFNAQGEPVQVRCLLDSGSQTSICTSALVKKLKLKAESRNLEISGLSERVMTSTKMLTLRIHSNIDINKSFKIPCAVLDKLTVRLPQNDFSIDHLRLPDHIILADPWFYKCVDVDVLIAVDILYEVLSPGIIRLGKDMPTLLNTYLGYVVGGKINLTKPQSISKSDFLSLPLSKDISLHSCTSNLDSILEKFWSLDQIEPKPILSPDGELAEKIFQETTIRLPDGRYQVNLPLKTPNEHLKLGDSFMQAQKRFLLLERRFQRDPELFTQYRAFIHEYIFLGHAKFLPVTLKNEKGENKFFLAHHPVLKPDSVSTKLRVVFDGSMKSNTGYSLNDVTLKGITVQSDLFDIVLRFRLFKYVLVSDIKKMYRMVCVNPSQTFLQNILWRDYPDEDLQCVELIRVTYGLNSSCYLTTRCLKDLAECNKKEFPLASNAIISQTYVDDNLAGATSYDELVQLYSQLNTLLNSAGFELHKFSSNSKKFTDTHLSGKTESYDIKIAEVSNKVLGLKWNSTNDHFTISLPLPKDQSNFKKREVLSKIAEMFDPCGFLAPVIVTAKIIMQKIWILKLDWDDQLPEDLLKEWVDFLFKIPSLKNVQIPRYLYLDNEILAVELHGFADASLKAYGACLYLRVTYVNNSLSSNLICAKSRVSPLKIVSLPRLELCGSLLLAKLVNKVLGIYENTTKFDSVNLWTDSEILLCWLASHPSRWNTFVANRVAEVQRLTNKFKWRHVISSENPADPLSRGISPDKIQGLKLWWYGPSFLQTIDTNLRDHDFNCKPNFDALKEERKPPKVSLHTSQSIGTDQNTFWYSAFLKFSNFYCLQRSIAYIFRFLNNAKPSSENRTDSLTVDELKHSLNFIMMVIQEKYFSKEILEIKSNKVTSNKSILTLNPFLDKSNILRVGGRLSKSNLPFEQKFPILLPAKEHISNLILKKTHLDLYHAGPQTVLSNVRLRFWPLNGLRSIKKISRECITCFRLKAQAAQQIMSDLPKFRVQHARVFDRVGVDFGGPILIKTSNLRQAKISKCYFAIFVCMVTKATHIEVVSELTTEAFLCTLKRFIARRGNPSYIYSDNATNFQGAKNQLKELYDFFKVDKHMSEVKDFLTKKETQWIFIPPRSPHWGGLWESSVKSTKFHIKRVIGESHFTFEKLTTVLAQIESILNSRPLCSLSNDPLDLDVLTPGHFIIGTSMTSFPERPVNDANPNRLDVWQNISRVQQIFWRRWSVEYLNQLQNRPKWLSPQINLKVNDLVLLKEDNVPPLRWPRARIVEVIHSSDNKVRVVKLKTSDSEFTRSITKVCPLPINN